MGRLRGNDMAALTDKAVLAAKAGMARREIPDPAAAGLYLVVQPSGVKSWAVRYRFAGRPRKMTLGAYPGLSLKDARERAGAARDIVAAGRDPAVLEATAVSERRSPRTAVEDLLDDFLKRHGPTVRESTRAEYERLIEKELKPRWKGRVLGSIDRHDVLSVIDDIRDRSAPVLANRTFAVARKFFAWTVERGILPMSPVLGARPMTPEVSRDRVLSDREVIALWRACDAVGAPWAAPIRLLLLTAQRREEVVAMRWSELDLAAGLWTLPKERAKNGKEHFVPLSTAALAALADAVRIKDSKYVFSTTGETAVSGISKAKARIDAAMLADLHEDDPAAILADWRLHDLRRTAATAMAALGHPPHVVEAVLNHKSGTIRGVSAVYNRHNYAAEKRAALCDWASHVAALVGKPKDNVLVMEKRSALRNKG